MFDIITVGSATVDVFARTNFSELIKIFSPKGETDLLAYPAGSKILIDELNFSIGGGAVNTAVAFKLLGLKTAVLSKLGKDDNAKFVRALLKKRNITDLTVSGKEVTGFSVILDSIEHDRTILIFRGANNNLKWGEVPKQKLKTKWFYMSTMMKESYKTLEKISEYATKNNIKIAFNTSEYLAGKGEKFLRPILKNTEILVLNQKEARLLSCKEKQKDVIETLHSFGPRIVAVTNGNKGVTTCNTKERYTMSPRGIPVVESTGAGDAFASAFITAHIKGRNLKSATQYGQLNAESVIQYHGAQNRLLSWSKILSLSKKIKYKVTQH